MSTMLCRDKDAQIGGIKDAVLRPPYVDSKPNLWRTLVESGNTKDSPRRLISDALL